MTPSNNKAERAAISEVLEAKAASMTKPTTTKGTSKGKGKNGKGKGKGKSKKDRCNRVWFSLSLYLSLSLPLSLTLARSLSLSFFRKGKGSLSLSIPLSLSLYPSLSLIYVYILLISSIPQPHILLPGTDTRRTGSEGISKGSPSVHDPVLLTVCFALIPAFVVAPSIDPYAAQGSRSLR